MFSVWERRNPSEEWKMIMTLPVEIASFVFVLAANFPSTLTLALIPDLLLGAVFESFNEKTEVSYLVAHEAFNPNEVSRHHTAPAEWN